jgi:hypothetical protein
MNRTSAVDVIFVDDAEGWPEVGDLVNFQEAVYKVVEIDTNKIFTDRCKTPACWGKVVYHSEDADELCGRFPIQTFFEEEDEWDFDNIIK